MSILVTAMIMLTIAMMNSQSLMLMWIFMEISNIMFIMVFILMQNNNINTPAPMLMMQFFSSSLILMGIIKSSYKLTSLGILIKLGMFPAHNWMPMVIFTSPWHLNMITLTLSKIPAFLFIDTLPNKNVIILGTIITPLIMTIKLAKTNNMKLIMALSSMIHSSWMVLAQMISFKCWLIYMILYTCNTIIMCKMMSLNMYYDVNKINATNKLMLMLLMFSMMSMPPVTMFLGKLYIMFMSDYKVSAIMMTLVVASMVSIMYYSRLFMKTIFMHKKINKIAPYVKPALEMTLIIFLLILIFIM